MNKKELINDIAKTKDYLKKKYDKKQFFQNGYYGYDAFFSYLKPSKIWIIGNNPGIGYWSLNEKIKENNIPLNHNEYFSPKDDNNEIRWYNVASSFWYLFNDNINNIELLEKECVITNLHFYYSENFKSLEKFISCFSVEDQNLYYSKIEEWNKSLLKIINPKIILSFGEIGIDFFRNNFNVKEIKSKKMGKEGREHLFYTFDDKVIIKIKRTISGIENRSDLGKMILKELKKKANN